MKRLRVLIFTAFLTLVGALGFGSVGIASAHSFRGGDNLTVSGSQPIDDTLFAAGRTVDISSEVNGDVFAAGQTVTVSGTVHGDVFAAGQTVSVSGTIDGDVRLAGQTVNLSGNVAGNTTIAGQSFVLDGKGSVGKDITVGATDTSLNGNVGRDVAAGGDSVVINGVVGGDVQTHSNRLKLGSGAKIAGNVDSTSQNDVQRESGATVGGKVTRHEPPKEQSKKEEKNSAGIAFVWFLYALVAALLTGLAIALLAPRLLEAVTDRAFPAPWAALLTGLVAHIVVPAILVVLAVTVVGIPLAIIIGLAWLLISLLSGVYSAYYVGRLVFSGQRHALLTMLVGGGILLLLYFIPIFGFLAILAAVWIGTGMQLLALYQRSSRPDYRFTGNEVTGKPARRS